MGGSGTVPIELTISLCQNVGFDSWRTTVWSDFRSKIVIVIVIIVGKVIKGVSSAVTVDRVGRHKFDVVPLKLDYFVSLLRPVGFSKPVPSPALQITLHPRFLPVRPNLRLSKRSRLLAPIVEIEPISTRDLFPLRLWLLTPVLLGQDVRLDPGRSPRRRCHPHGYGRRGRRRRRRSEPTQVVVIIKDIFLLETLSDLILLPASILVSLFECWQATG